LILIDIYLIIGCKSDTKGAEFMDKNMVYQIINGEINMDMVDIPTDMEIEDEFAEGKKCARLYDEVYEAKQRILRKLRTDDDADIETIIRNMGIISEILALKMYDYGEMNDFENSRTGD
jgi:hypothetical protein